MRAALSNARLHELDALPWHVGNGRQTTMVAYALLLSIQKPCWLSRRFAVYSMAMPSSHGESIKNMTSASPFCMYMNEAVHRHGFCFPLHMMMTLHSGRQPFQKTSSATIDHYLHRCRFRA